MPCPPCHSGPPLTEMKKNLVADAALPLMRTRPGADTTAPPAILHGGLRTEWGVHARNNGGQGAPEGEACVGRMAMYLSHRRWKEGVCCYMKGTLVAAYCSVLSILPSTPAHTSLCSSRSQSLLFCQVPTCVTSFEGLLIRPCPSSPSLPSLSCCQQAAVCGLQVLRGWPGSSAWQREQTHDVGGTGGPRWPGHRLERGPTACVRHRHCTTCNVSHGHRHSPLHALLWEALV